MNDVQSNFNDTWCRKHFWKEYFQGRKKFLSIFALSRNKTGTLYSGRKFILTGSYERAYPNYRTISKNWVPSTQIHFEILSLKILLELLRSRGWSDLQTFGIKMTALILSFMTWSRIFEFPAWWRERAKWTIFGEIP